MAVIIPFFVPIKYPVLPPLLSTLNKILEKIIHQKLTFLDTNDLPNLLFQYGCRRGRSALMTPTDLGAQIYDTNVGLYSFFFFFDLGNASLWVRTHQIFFTKSASVAPFPTYFETI